MLDNAQRRILKMAFERDFLKKKGSEFQKFLKKSLDVVLELILKLSNHMVLKVT